MQGPALAARAVLTMADAVRLLAARHHLEPSQFASVICHGGNGRMPALLARQLGLAADVVKSEAVAAGDLGSASLPVAWAASVQPPTAPVAWVTVCAGLQWGAAILEGAPPVRVPAPP